MKTAGDILSALFDERFMKKAQGYSKLFDSWEDITAKNGIASAAAHSRIKDLNKGILLVEMDHPGWKQILQTKQSKLLNDFRRRFPDLDISGISLMLGSSEPPEKQLDESSPSSVVDEQAAAEDTAVFYVKEPVAGYDAIKDEDFREKLIKLGQTITEKNKR
ncbi:MAG: DUF721 domain-containing protein [Treponema sp.]|nr:DUF721 domain-containing protein [Treponema sp.]MCL2272736.1 DUF721 domain-containing protein [Treponema sp.]